MSSDYPDLKKITQIEVIAEKVREYIETLKSKIEEIIVTDRENKSYSFEEGVNLAIEIILEAASCKGKLIFIGNGASASISSHLATDFWKNAKIKAISFNDSSLLTCISNDYGYSHVFEKPIEMFSEPQDVLIAISSSGKSENILKAVSAAKRNCLKVITLSGFKLDNLLRRLGDLNFYVPIAHYGQVEIVHSAICHCLVDIIIENKSKLSKKQDGYE